MKRSDRTVIDTLASEIASSLGRVDELDALLEKNRRNIGRHEHLVTAAYHLSGIYSCLEDIFFKIAKVFENRVENPSSWHRELLDRMRISVRNVRPQVIGDDSFSLLDEMRRFRHVFRSSYMFSLKRPQVELLIGQWDRGKGTIRKEIVRFVKAIS